MSVRQARNCKARAAVIEGWRMIGRGGGIARQTAAPIAAA
jgi:hypothetical protein